MNNEITGIGPELACRSCPPETFDFESTEQIEGYDKIIGQNRALEAIELGIGVTGHDFHIYVMGPEGFGKHSLVKRLLKEHAHEMPPALDWCYVHNFKDPSRPKALSFPAGQGVGFQGDILGLIRQLLTEIPEAFKGTDYQSTTESISEELREFVNNEFEKLEKIASRKNIGLVSAQEGMMFVPLGKDGEPIPPHEYENMDKDDRKEVEEIIFELEKGLKESQKKIAEKSLEVEKKLHELNEKITFNSVGYIFQELRDKYKNDSKVVSYLGDVLEDVVTHVERFLTKENGSDHIAKKKGNLKHLPPDFKHYEVNLLVSNEDNDGAPVIYEDFPNHHNLIGRIEYQAQMGMMTTNFTLIKPGALHRANGGFLILDVGRLLMQPYAWENLKRVLESRELKIEPVERMLGFNPTHSLDPEPIGMGLKVVLIGDRFLFYLLNYHDPDFRKIFKVEADFEESMDWGKEELQNYASLLSTLCRQHDLLPLERNSVCRMVEHSMRLAGDTKKLTTSFQEILDLVREANYQATKSNKKMIEKQDIEAAIKAKIRRSSRVPDLMRESVEREILLIDTVGKKVGQLNAISLIKLGDTHFGYPVRITARVFPGKGDLINIEREVNMSGPIHSKGVLILAGFLGSRYAQNMPLTLNASIVFEQSYGGIDGDSATIAETCTLLSALSGVAINQSFAVTGSMNQEGEVQAIGGVNEKIEGFFEICKRRGLTGDQGVLIPKINIQHLMLKEEVVNAISEGNFQVYPIEKIDDAITLMMGTEAGVRNKEGQYPEGTVNAKVEERLIKFGETIKAFGQTQGDEISVVFDPKAIDDVAAEEID